MGSRVLLRRKNTKARERTKTSAYFRGYNYL
jgi:hypothetical protein